MIVAAVASTPHKTVRYQPR